MPLRSLLVYLACVAALPAPASAIARAPQAQAPKPRVDTRAQADALLAARRFAEAEAAYVEHLRRAPNDGEAWNQLGVCQFSRRSYLAAAESFAKADGLGLKSADLLNNLGAAQFLSERTAQARTTFERSLAAAPGNSRAHLFLARIAVRDNDAARAESQFKLAVAGDAPDPAALYHFGAFLLQERRLEEAKAQLERAVGSDATYASAHHSLGLVLRRMGDSAGAARHLARFRELTELEVGTERQMMRVSASLKACYKEIENGNLEAALTLALEAADEGPQFPVVHQTVADVYRRMGRTAEAEVAARKAKELTQSQGGAK
ncbi:MAG: tetratricopeptide repeat protein [Planctomycetes bacterium]|nr:tetratricopeptide repeat protein [Planctomycetota bacterium]